MKRRLGHGMAAAAIAVAVLLAGGGGAVARADAELTPPGAVARADAVLTLPDALARAEKITLDFAKSSARRAKAELLWSRALAGLQPTVIASGTLALGKPIESSAGAVRAPDSESGGASLSVSLFDGGAIAGAVAAHALRDSERAGAAADEAAARATVVRAYYAALAADELVGVAERATTAAEAHVTDADVRHAEGAALKIDVTRAKLEAVKARADLASHRAAAASARALIALLCGLDGDVTLVRPPPPDVPAAAGASILELERRALASRADLHSAAIAVDAARKSRAAARWALAPTLTLNGSTGVSSVMTLDTPGLDYGVSLKLSWTLYDGGARFADITAGGIDLHTAEVAASELHARVLMEVRNGARDLEVARGAVVSSTEEVALARETLALAEERYRAGSGSGLEVVEATQALTAAEGSLVTQELSAALSGVELLRALGDDLRDAGR